MILQTLAAKVAHGSALRNSDGVHEGRTTFGEGNKGHSDAKRWKQIQADQNRLSLTNVYSVSDVDPAHIAVVPSLASGPLLIQQRGPGPQECGPGPHKCGPPPRLPLLPATSTSHSLARLSYLVALTTSLPPRELSGVYSSELCCIARLCSLQGQVPLFSPTWHSYISPV